MFGWRDLDSPTAMRRRDDDAYRQDWAEAHGYLPRTERPPLPPAHLCPAQYGYLVSGSREGCPHCKLPAPLDAGPGRE